MTNKDAVWSKIGQIKIVFEANRTNKDAVIRQLYLNCSIYRIILSIDHFPRFQ